MPSSLTGTVAVVAGATRGAGRGIACALGEAGATVYCTGRSVRGAGATPGRPETIDETAELVTALGGRGIAVRADHTVEADVVALFDRVRAEQGRLDVLVNNVWGGDALTEWGRRFWEVDLPKGFALLERGLHTHLITARHGAPLLMEGERGLLVEITDGVFAGYRWQVFYDLCKASIVRFAYAMSVELGAEGSGVTALALTPGFLRSEAMLERFGVTEATWRDGIAADPNFAASETPRYVGRAVAALAADPDVHQRAGTATSSWALARTYGFTDLDGSQPHWDDHLDGRIAAILAGGPPNDEERLLLTLRRPQLDFDPARAEEQAAIAAFLEAHPA